MSHPCYRYRLTETAFMHVFMLILYLPLWMYVYVYASACASSLFIERLQVLYIVIRFTPTLSGM